MFPSFSKLVLMSTFIIFQSMHSSLENEAVVDLSGLHESVVDSDEDLADSLDVSLQKKTNLPSGSAFASFFARAIASSS